MAKKNKDDCDQTLVFPSNCIKPYLDFTKILKLQYKVIVFGTIILCTKFVFKYSNKMGEDSTYFG